MKKISIYILLMIAIKSISFAQGEYGVGLGLGSGGYEFRGIYRMNEFFSASLDYNNFDLDNIVLDDLGSDGQEIEGSGIFKISSIKAMLHYHPFASGFRLSAGYGLNLTDISFDIEGTNIEIEGETTDISGSITIDTGSQLPYVGVGWGYNFDDFIALDFSLGILFLQKITGEDLVDYDITVDSDALTDALDAIDDDASIPDDLATTYPDVAAALADGDPFALYEALEENGIITSSTEDLFADIPNPDSFLGDIQDQIDEFVENSGFGLVQDMIGYAPLPIFSFGFSIFF